MGGDSGHRSGTNHQEGSGAWDYSAKSVRTGLGISCPLGCCIAEVPRHPPQSAIKSADATLPALASKSVPDPVVVPNEGSDAFVALQRGNWWWHVRVPPPPLRCFQHRTQQRPAVGGQKDH